MQRLEKYDPGNKFGIPYLWGTTGIAYNVDMIKKRMPNASLDSWKMIFEPENLKRFADCGIYMLDAGDEVIPAALKYLGEDPIQGSGGSREGRAGSWNPPLCA